MRTFRSSLLTSLFASTLAAAFCLGQSAPSAAHANQPPAPPPLPLPPIATLPANGLALTPPMGWNSWNHFESKVDDKTIREIADALVSSGMRDAGYVYVNIDDTWEGTRDKKGEIHANSKFPNMKALADYVHSKGLKLGIYSSPGPKTCAGYEGSYGHEDQDAKTYAAWGIDYLKYDWCSAGDIYTDADLRAVYQKMGAALQKTGRPIVYSLCEYGKGDVWKWGPEAGANLWRTTGDINDTWKRMAEIGFDQPRLNKYAGPGHWNDPDMLEIGNGGMTTEEYKTHMTLWAMLAAPLLAGNDLRTMTKETHDLLTNSEVLAVDQDTAGTEPTRVYQQGGIEGWVRPLADGGVALTIFNRNDQDQAISLNWYKDLKLARPDKIRDAWEHEDVVSTKIIARTMPAHGSLLWVLHAH